MQFTSWRNEKKSFSLIYLHVNAWLGIFYQLHEYYMTLQAFHGMAYPHSDVNACTSTNLLLQNHGHLYVWMFSTCVKTTRRGSMMTSFDSVWNLNQCNLFVFMWKELSIRKLYLKFESPIMLYIVIFLMVVVFKKLRTGQTVVLSNSGIVEHWYGVL